MLNQPLGMRSAMLVRVGTLDMELGGPSGATNCRVALQARTVSENVLSAGNMIDVGNYPLETDSDYSGGR